MVATAYLQDLIAAGFMAPEMSYLACDPSKLARARKAAMESSREKNKDKYKTEKIVGIGYDGGETNTQEPCLQTADLVSYLN